MKFTCCKKKSGISMEDNFLFEKGLITNLRVATDVCVFCSMFLLLFIDIETGTGASS